MDDERENENDYEKENNIVERERSYYFECGFNAGLRW